jgi:hypothetical protein
VRQPYRPPLLVFCDRDQSDRRLVKAYGAIAFLITTCVVGVAAHNAYNTTPHINRRINDNAHVIARRVHELYSWYADALPGEYSRLEQHELAAALLEKYFLAPGT